MQSQSMQGTNSIIIRTRLVEAIPKVFDSMSAGTFDFWRYRNHVLARQERVYGKWILRRSGSLSAQRFQIFIEKIVNEFQYALFTSIIWWDFKL
jgi:hypothetical protein